MLYQQTWGSSKYTISQTNATSSGDRSRVKKALDPISTISYHVGCRPVKTPVTTLIYLDRNYIEVLQEEEYPIEHLASFLIHYADSSHSNKLYMWH